MYAYRAGGYVIDGVILGIVDFVLIVFGVAFVHGSSLDLAYVFVVAFDLWYLVWRLGRRGQTWGMQLAHVVLVDKATGQRSVGLGRALVRLVFAAAIAAVPFGLLFDLLWPLWNPYKQTLHDKVAGTVVVNKR
jgi:uncharacterized RDD family membrane protein YckC